MQEMDANNRNLNKRSSIKDFLKKIKSCSNSSMPAVSPQASNFAKANLLHQLAASQSPPLCLSSGISSLPSSQSVPMNLRRLPYAMINEILQQQQQFDKIKADRRQMEKLLSPKPVQSKPSQQLETIRKENTILWERLKQYECAIKNLEQTQSKLTRVNAKLEVDLNNHMAINKCVVQRNTKTVLDISSKDQQISVLNKQNKHLTKQNTKLKLFLRQTDSYLDSIQNQQYILQFQQKQMHQDAPVASNDLVPTSGSKKRKRSNSPNDESDCGEPIDGRSTPGNKRNNTANVPDGSSIISDCSTSDGDNPKLSREKDVLDYPKVTS